MKKLHKTAGLFVVALAIGLAPALSRADDFVYAPDGCDFRMTFPEKPSTQNECDPEDPKDCYKKTTFLRSFPGGAFLKATAVCTVADQELFDAYSQEAMEFTLEAMAKKKVQEYNLGFADHAQAKQATLLGSRTDDNGDETLYMSQMWLSPKSFLNVEVEVTGPQEKTADDLFTAIVRSIDMPALSNAPAAKTDEKPDDQPAENKDKKEDGAGKDKGKE